MGRFYSYSIIQFAAHAVRGERLNIGLAIFHDQTVDVRLPKRLEKLRAISGALDIDAVKDSVTDLKRLDDYARSEGHNSLPDRLARINSLAPIQLSALGAFDGTSSYEDAIDKLLHQLVEPEPAPVRTIRKRPSKLLADFKKALRDEGVLAQKGEDLNSHRVVPNHRIAEGLAADLVLKNTYMHIFEAVDASNEEISPRKIISDIAVSALVFEQARMKFGESDTKSRLVYQASASTEVVASSALLAAEHQGAELINWESFTDRKKLVDLIASLATPIENLKQRNTFIHASNQHKFKLN